MLRWVDFCLIWLVLLSSRQTNFCESFDNARSDEETAGVSAIRKRSSQSFDSAKRLKTTAAEDGQRSVRSDDADPDHVVLEQHAQQIAQLTAQVQALTNKLNQKVAFFSHLQQTEYTAIGHGATLKFDGVDINVGNGFDPNTGIFRAPYAGVYIFHIKLLSSIDYGMTLDIKTTPNNKIVATTEVWSVHVREVATAQGVVHLTAGQSVWVAAYPRDTSSSGGHLYGLVYTTFSGYLLYSD